MLKKKRLMLTPLALAAAMAAGSVYAQGAVGEGRLATAVSNVTSALSLNGDRAVARDGNTGNSQRALSLRGDGDSERGLLRRNGSSESLPGLASADDRTTLRERVQARADERQERDPLGGGFELNLGNTSDDADARGVGLRVTHDATLHAGTAEDEDSLIDNGDETVRSGLDTGTGIHVMHTRATGDGDDRERVASGIESGANLFNHAPKERGEGESYRSAELSNFLTQRTVEDGVLGDDEDSRRIGAALQYDSRSGFAVERGGESD